MKYKVLITETLKMLVTVEANSKFEAEQIVSDNYSDNFSDVDFSAEKMIF